MADLTRLRSREELAAWLDRSRTEPVWIFKHSLTCGVSARALEEFRAFARDGGAESACALIEVQTARELASELARRTGVLHESPQALLLRDAQAVWHASHWQIRAEALRRGAADLARRPR